MAKQKNRANEAAAKAKSRTDATIAKQMTVAATRAMAKFESVKKSVHEEHSIARTLTVDMGSAAIAHTTDQLLQFGMRALAEYSQRTQGAEGHFAKHVGIWSSAPQSAIGMIVYILELATRDKNTMKLSLGRDLANRASSLLTNLGLANSFRAVRYYLASSIDEDHEEQAQKAALMNKIAELTKQLDEAKK